MQRNCRCQAWEGPATNPSWLATPKVTGLRLPCQHACAEGRPQATALSNLNPNNWSQLRPAGWCASRPELANPSWFAHAGAKRQPTPAAPASLHNETRWPQGRLAPTTALLDLLRIFSSRRAEHQERTKQLNRRHAANQTNSISPARDGHGIAYCMLHKITQPHSKLSASAHYGRALVDISS